MKRIIHERPHYRRGLTLIELIAALVLLAVLMTALLGLVPRFASRALDRDAMGEVIELHWTRVVLERLADDLQNARSAQFSGDTLQLTGRLARDPNTGRMNDRNGSCQYQFSQLQDRELLLREQAGVKELLGCGQIFLVIEAVDDQSPDQAPDQAREQPMIRLPARRAVVASQPLDLMAQMRLSIQSAAGETLGSVVVIREPVTGSMLQTGQVQ